MASSSSMMAGPLKLSRLQLSQLSPSQLERIPQFQQISSQGQHILELDLSCNELTVQGLLAMNGNSDPLGSIGHMFPALTKLDLSSNTIEALNEVYIKNITGLTWLDLKCNLIADVSVEALQSLSACDLEYLGLNNNHIRTLPSVNNNVFSKLTTLWLDNNEISHIALSFSSLTCLTELGLNNNRLLQLPEDIGKATALKCIDATQNKISKLPASICELEELDTLHLCDNVITQIPLDVWKMSSLTTLTLDRNQLCMLPASIGKLSSLTELRLGWNQLQTLPDECGCLEALRELYVNDNRLVSLPALKNSHLRVLNASNNQLEDPLSPEVGCLTSLQVLRLGNNRITKIPQSFGQLKNHIKVLEMLPNPLSQPFLRLTTRGTESILDYLNDLGLGVYTVSQVKLFVVGNKCAGKTTLLNTLRKGFFARMLTRDPGAIRTAGVEVHHVTSSNVEFCAFDFAGQIEYYGCHEIFLSGRCGIFILVCDLSHSEYQAHAIYWLSLLKSKIDHISSQDKNKPFVLIVGSHIDCYPSSQDQRKCVVDAEAFLSRSLIPAFSSYFSFGSITALDCRKGSSSLRGLTQVMEDQARAMLAAIPPIPAVYQRIFEYIKDIREGNSSSNLLPITLLPWTDLYALINRGIGCDAALLHRACLFWDDLGEILFIQDNKEKIERNIVITDPQWFAKQVLSRLFGPEGVEKNPVKASNGCVPHDTIHSLLLPTVPLSVVVQMLQDLGLCWSEGSQCVFPVFLLPHPPPGCPWSGLGYHTTSSSTLLPDAALIHLPISATEAMWIMQRDRVIGPHDNEMSMETMPDLAAPKANAPCNISGPYTSVAFFKTVASPIDLIPPGFASRLITTLRKQLKGSVPWRHGIWGKTGEGYDVVLDLDGGGQSFALSVCVNGLSAKEGHAIACQTLGRLNEVVSVLLLQCCPGTHLSTHQIGPFHATQEPP